MAMNFELATAIPLVERTPATLEARECHPEERSDEGSALSLSGGR